MLVRCPWAEGSDLERDYHDIEWGVPVRDDVLQFEFLVLESFSCIRWSSSFGFANMSASTS